MGVHGSWRLIEPSGKPVPVESLENKILAVDVSIWSHQAIKGFQDAKGAPALNAHLSGIFHRVCKLLYFKIKPVFVFDGGVPVLKRETIAKRNKLKQKNISEADKIQKQLLDTLIKHSAVNKVLGEKAKTELASASSKQERTSDDLFKSPKTDVKSENSDEETSSESDYASPTKNWNLHNIDTRSEHFKSLPADVRHEILTELKETRKQSSWGRLHELPTQSDDFSGFQMKRLSKRQEVQLALEEAQKEMGGHSLSLLELEEILKDQGVISKNDIGSRIASDENKRYLYIKDVKQALEKARREEEKKNLNAVKEKSEEKDPTLDDLENDLPKKNKSDLEFETDMQTAIALSSQEQPSGSGQVERKKLSEFSFLENFDIADCESDTEEEEDLGQIVKSTKLTSAQNYMMEYSGLTPNEIAKIIANNEKKKTVKRKLVTILEDDGQKKEAERSEKESSNVKESEEPNVKKIKLTQKKELSESENSSDDFEEVENHDVETESEGLQLNDDAEAPKIMETRSKIFTEEDVKKNENNFKHMNTDDDSSKMKENMVENADEVSIVKLPVEVISGSDESENDFEEVEEIPLTSSKTGESNLMEIKIEAKEYNEEDDLFADIFTTTAKTSEMKYEEKNIEKTEIERITNEKIEVEMKKGVETESNDLTKEIEQNFHLLQDSMKKADDVKSNESNQKNEDKQKTDDRVKLSEKDLETLRDDSNKEEQELRNEQGLRERLGTNITDQMYQEAQDLLELFGLPYVVAPMEAEAQCAFLESASLTDGTITDDSDIWLFGGKTVYKNFFNQSKHVSEYRAEDIKHHFKLTREQMILSALLVGSDYTTGLQGVGPVTAMEILAHFPPSSTSSFTLSHNQLLMGSNEFKSWFMGGKAIARGKNSSRNKLKNVTFVEGFPSMQVVQAYSNPTIDNNEEQFSWSKPDIVGLIDFGRSKFGWSKIKTEDILKPVIKRMKESKYQSTLLNYFKIKHDLNAEEAQKLMSERVRSAVKRIGKDPKDMEESDDSEEKESKTIKKKKSVEENKVKTNVSTGKRKLKKKKTKDVEELLSDDEFIESDQIEKSLENIEKQTDKSKKGKKAKVAKPSKLLGTTESVSQTKVDANSDGNKSMEEQTSSKSIENSEPGDVKEPVSVLENKEMNLLITVLSNQEPSSSENASKIARVKKIAEKIEKKQNPISTEEQEPSIKQKKATKKLKKSKDNDSAEGQEEPSTSRRESNVMKLKRIAKQLEGKSVKQPEEKKQPRKRKTAEASTSKALDNVDEELKLSQETESFSEKRVEDIKAEAKKLLQYELNKKKLIGRKLHRKEVIPQRERQQKNLINTRLRAIEVFRKSKIDPSSKKGGPHRARPPKEDAELSESSSDSDL